MTTYEQKVKRCLVLLKDEEISEKFTSLEVLEEIKNSTINDIAEKISDLNHLLYCINVILNG